MKTIETIKTELKEVKYYYAMCALFANDKHTRILPPENVVNMVKDYGRRISHAPIRLRLAYDNLYRLGKRQKDYAQECGVTDKYIQILNKRIVVYFYNSFNKEQKL